MGLVAKGGRNQDTKLAGTSQSLFMDTCADCGAPVTIVGATKPAVFRCQPCAVTAAAAATAAAEAASSGDDPLAGETVG